MTRWEVIRTAVLPHGRSGVISASMLGLGRALGETIAVMIILTQPAPGSPFTPSIFAGGETFASKIANNAQEFDTPSKTGAFIASGLVLFVVTFAVNAVARIIAERGKCDIVTGTTTTQDLVLSPAERTASDQEHPCRCLCRTGHRADHRSAGLGALPVVAKVHGYF